MSYSLLACGYRDTFALLSFDPSTAKLKTVAQPTAPKGASWLEPALSSKGEGKIIYTLSEQEKGFAATLEVKGDDVKVTSKAETDDSPAHIHAMKDGSGIVVANYGGASAIFIPLKADGTLAQTSSASLLRPPFVYKDQDAPNKERQDMSHPHQVVEGEGGKLFIPDLGSDRVWVVKRKGQSDLEIEGYLQCPPGSGPRHCVLSPNGKHLYVVTELTSTIIVFAAVNSSYPSHPLPNFEQSIIPSTVPDAYKNQVFAAELLLNPAHPHVLYASNRGELHLKESKGLPPPPAKTPEGDAIAIIVLNEKGDSVKDITHVRTACDYIRAMQVSPDGKFVALAGQRGGGVEIWTVSGNNGEEWKLAAKDESIDGVTDFTWL